MLGHFSLSAPRAVPPRCLISSNIVRYFVDLATTAYDAVLQMLEHGEPGRHPIGAPRYLDAEG